MAPTILVVDDNPDDLEIMRFVLAECAPHAGFLAAGSGEAAIDMLRASAELPGLVLMDVKMPGMGGIATLQRLRAEDRTCRMPVVMLSHSTLDDDRDAAIAAGAQGFLRKEFELSRVQAELGPLLARWLGECPAGV